ncbi:hypothetical protein PmNV_028 [Penaeus monodon nudivirus]|uniref:Uncharacterized protein n=1 Tax=Penaeus monodon nudivirus TaxID=1529056 RepID=A0A076FIW2_9VIRU|nr:hypothetical protein PmNV_028 [Penaeus monodon nudivirus]AII15816.1 hypothetical protein PmNV_028 [Penaeus monodon nudivirus]
MPSHHSILLKVECGIYYLKDKVIRSAGLMIDNTTTTKPVSGQDNKPYQMLIIYELNMFLHSKLSNQQVK